MSIENKNCTGIRYGIEFEGCLKIPRINNELAINAKLKEMNNENFNYLEFWKDNYFIDVNERFLDMKSNNDFKDSPWFNDFLLKPYFYFKYPENTDEPPIILNIENNEIVEKKSVLSYDYPQFTSDGSVVCRSNLRQILKIIKDKIEKEEILTSLSIEDKNNIIDILLKATSGKSNSTNEADAIHQLKIKGFDLYHLFELNSPTIFSINVEIITPPFNSILDVNAFMNLFLLRPIDNLFILNATAGTHITYDISKLDIKQIFKNILSCYIPWQENHAEDVRLQLKYFNKNPPGDMKYSNIFKIFYGPPHNLIKGVSNEKEHTELLKYIDGLSENEMKDFIDNFLNGKRIRKPSLKFKWRDYPEPNLLEVRLLGASSSIYKSIPDFVLLFEKLLFCSSSDICEYNETFDKNFYDEFMDMNTSISTNLEKVSGGTKTKRKKQKKNKTKKNKPAYKNKYIFFYGTLRKNGTNYGRIDNNPDIKYIGKFKTENKYSFIGLKSGSFPYASEDSFSDVEKVNVVGELYEIMRNKREFIQNIDKLEYNYSRQFANIIMNGKKVKSYIYLLTNPELIKEIEPNISPNGRQRFVYIDSGDWINWKESQRGFL